MSKPRLLPHVSELTVTHQGRTVGKLSRVETRGIYFTYDKVWLSEGFNLSPFMMVFDERPQLARDNLFGGLHGPFADSLPDGWGLLLMDRFFNSRFGAGTSLALTSLDRLAYMGDRAMGALEYRPTTDNEHPAAWIDLAELFQASMDIQDGDTSEVVSSVRLAGGSPGGARPKAIVALSDDGGRARSAFAPLPADYRHWIVKFRGIDESPAAGSIEQAYALLAARSGVDMAPSTLLDVPRQDGGVETVFAIRRFDRDGSGKHHMMTASALVHADFRTPSLDYSELLKLTNGLTRNAREVERMARLMVFNALSHNYDDHAKNFSFLRYGSGSSGDANRWVLAPAYDLTFSQGMGEHTTAFAGRGTPTRKLIRDLCRDFRYLDADDYIEQTLAAFATRDELFASLRIPERESEGMFRVLDDVLKRFEGTR